MFTQEVKGGALDNKRKHKGDNEQQPLFKARVIKIEENSVYLKNHNRGTFRARVAFSCAVVPQQEDIVLVAETGNSFFVLAILERKDPRSIEMNFNGNLEVNINGELTVKANNNIKILSSDETQLLSRDISMFAREVNIRSEKISLIGEVLKKQFHRIKAVVREVENFFVRYIVHSKDSSHYVTENHELQARSSRLVTEETMTVQTKNSVHLAEELITMNAKQINLG